MKQNKYNIIAKSNLRTESTPVFINEKKKLFKIPRDIIWIVKHNLYFEDWFTVVTI